VELLEVRWRTAIGQDITYICVRLSEFWYSARLRQMLTSRGSVYLALAVPSLPPLFSGAIAGLNVLPFLNGTLAPCTSELAATSRNI